MPRFDYEHTAFTTCPEIFEVFQRMSDDPLEFCPGCGGPVRKLIAVPAVIVKGSPEKAKDSTIRLTGEKRPHFDCPYVNEQGVNERIYTDTGSKAENKSKIREAVLRTKFARRRNLKHSDVNPFGAGVE